MEGLKEKDAYNLIRFSVSSPGSLISLDSVEEESAKKICKNLGCHPLAISVASGVKGNDVSFTSLLRQIEENPLNVIEPDDFELPLDHRRSIVKLFEISIARLSEDARTLLRIAHHVALVPIPRSLIQHSIVQLGCPSDRCEKVVSDSIGRLERHCLGRTQAPDVSRDFQGGLLIHGLVRQVINKISPPQVMDATLDVYRTNAKGEPVFVEIPPPSDEQVWEVLERIIKRVMKQLVRRGILVEDQGETYLADDGDDSEESRTLRPLHRGSCVYRIAFGPRAGQKVLTLQGALPREKSGKQKLCANLQGFSLHAAVRCGAGQRKTLERLCRYIARPALANERVQCNAAGQVELKLKTPWRDGTTHQVMSPLEFMQRLAALVPRPRLHLIR